MARDTLENMAQKGTMFSAWPKKKKTRSWLSIIYALVGLQSSLLDSALGMSHLAIFLNNFLFRVIQTSYHKLFKRHFPFLRWVCRQDFLIFSFAHDHVDLNVQQSSWDFFSTLSGAWIK